MSDRQKISFLEDYVLSSNRLDTTASAFNEDTEEYWQYSLLYILNKSEGGKDAQTQAFLKKLEKSSFKNSDIIKNLLFRQQLKSFDSSARKSLIKQIKEIVGISSAELSGERKGGDGDEKKGDVADGSDEKQPDIVTGVGTKKLKKGGIDVDISSAIKYFLNTASEQYLNLADLFSPSAVDSIATKDSIGKLKKDQIAGVLELLKDSAPTSKCLLELVMRDLKENNTQFGKREIHKKLTVDQLKKLGEMDGSLYKNLSFVTIMAGKLRPISDVKWQNNEAYCKAYLDKLRAFARGPLKHITFKALILFNYLRFYETVAQPDGSADIAAYQAAVYGNDSKKKSIKTNPKFPTYDRDTLAAYLSLPRRGAPFTASQASSKAASSMITSVDTSFELCDQFPELSKIGNDIPFISRAIGYFFLKGDLTGAWPQLKKEWSLIIFAKEKLMASAGNDKFLKAQEGAIKDGLSGRDYRKFVNSSELRLFETNRKFYKVKDIVTIEYFTKNNPEITFNIYQLNCKSYYLNNASEIPIDISLSGAVPLKSLTKKYSKDKNIIRRADSITIKSLKDKRGIFIIDLIGKNINTRCFIRKGELRFIYEQTENGYDFYVFDENYNQIMKPNIYMNGIKYGVTETDEKSDEKEKDKERPGKITLPYADGENDILEQLIIIEDSEHGASSAVLRSFKRQLRKYEMRGGFYIDRENLLSKQEAILLVRSNLYLCNEQTSLNICNKKYSFVTLEFKTLDGNVTKDVRRVQLKDDSDVEIKFTVPTNLREISCKLETKINDSNIDLSISHKFKVNGIDACPFIADVFLLPNNKKGYYLLTVGKNGEIFANERLDIELYHKHFKSNRCVECTITTDANGLFELGKLENITSIKVKPKNTSFFSEKEFNLLQDLVNVPERICRKEATTIKIPFSCSNNSTPTINIYDAQYSSDISKAASYKNGYVIIEKLPPGDYIVYISDILTAKVILHISGGKLFDCHLGEYVLSNSRILQLSEDTPLQITAVKSGGDSEPMEIQLSGYNNMTRVHCIITSLLPVFTPYQSLCAPCKYPDVIDFISLSNSIYTPTTKCNPEFLYILNRNRNKKLEKNVSNNLFSPSMIFGKYSPPQALIDSINEPSPKQFEKIQAIFKSRYENILQESFACDINNKSDDTSNVEFLPQPSLIFSNLKCNSETGIVIIPKFKKSDFRCIQIIATDDDNTALLNYIINKGAPIVNGPKSDIRLSNQTGFDPKKHYSPVRKIQCLNKSEEYKINDINACKYIPFERLSCLFDLYSGLIGENNKSEQILFENFRPLVEWNNGTLSEEEKLRFYDEFMCHEVNYFLYKRDRQFFENTISPILENKINKEFMDLYLLDRVSKLTDYGNDSYLFSRLNTFEQILLCTKIKDGDALSKATLRSIEETADLMNKNPKFDDRIFDASKYRNRINLIDEVICINEPKEEIKEEKQEMEMKAQEIDLDSDAETDIDEGDEKYNPFNNDETIMYQECGYYNIPGSQSTSDLIKPSKFWKDFALYLLQDGGKGSFLSPFIGRVCSNENNINEALLALCICDLNLEATEPQLLNRNKIVSSDGPSVIFLEEMIESKLQSSTLSVHSNYFDPRDSSEIVHGEKVDKFVIGTFETRKIYGCRSVITNVSSVKQEIEVLIQIPTGSIAVNQSYTTKSYNLTLSPFMTERLTYYFYFPQIGKFKCFPVHINKNGKTIAYSLDERLINMEVVGEGSDIMINKKQSELKNNWDYITSSHGTTKDIVSFISSNPRAYEVDLNKCSKRLAKDSKFFDNLTAVLKERGIYDECVWKFALISDKGGGELSEYLSQQNKFLEYIHPYFESDKFNYNPFDRFDWSLTEFAPLISNRCECDSQIQPLSDSFLDEYGKFLLLVAFRSFSAQSITIIDKLIFVQYLIYQERINEAKQIFKSINEKNAKQNVSALFYDYLQCYLLIYDGANPTTLQQILMKCMSWKAKPLPKSLSLMWEKLELIAKEVEKPETVKSIFDDTFIEEENNKQTQFIDFKILEKKGVKWFDISFRNLDQCIINFYKVDLELLFSQNPFTSADNLNKLINLIAPNEVLTQSLPKESTSPPDKKFKPTDNNIHHYLTLPDQYKQQNIIIQFKGVGCECIHPLNDNSFNVQFDKNNQLGQCRIVYGNKKDKENFKKPIIGAYCKVYSKNKNEPGKSKFYKDGYTDIRGRFDYKNVSTNQLANSSQLALFVQTPNNGSSVVTIAV